MKEKKVEQVDIRIRTVKQYINDFLVEGLKGKAKVTEMDLIPVKQQMLDAFRKEIFEQIIDKLGPEAATMSRDDLAKLEKVNNILVQSARKWKRICIICSEHGLGNFFQLEDLRRVLDDENEKDPEEIILPDNDGVDVTEELEEKPVYLEKETAEAET